VEVLAQQHQGLKPGQRQEPLNQGVEDASAPHLGALLEGRVRQGEEPAEERDGLRGIQAHLLEPDRQALDPLGGSGLIGEAEALPHQLDHGLERAARGEG
jgi:hypothetical protein